MKRSLSLIMTIVMVLSLFGGFAPYVYAAEEGSSGQTEHSAGLVERPVQVLRDDRIVSTVVPEASPASPDELLAGYVDQVFLSYSAKKSEPSRGTIHIDLEGDVNIAIYNALRPQIEKVAAGEETSTEFSFPAASVGIDSSVIYTAEDLGVTSLWDDEGYFSYEAQMAMLEEAGIDLVRIISALVNNCPYELYWFDKTVGSYTDLYAFYDDGVGFADTMTISFSVEKEYQGSADFTVDPSAGQAVQHAAAKAASIVEANAALSDYQKLTAYKDAICGLTSYNHPAVDEEWDYGNPWQLIWVFDEVENTTVVCEGYSKAFQYLCQLSSFSSNMIESRIVTGDMVVGTGSEAHMWNIVTMDDGSNYLVDITNCDSNAVGAPDQLFLKAASGSVSGGYTIDCNGTNVGYVYDSYTQDLYNTEVLTLSGEDYVYGQESSPAFISVPLCVPYYFTAPVGEENAVCLSFTAEFAGEYYFGPRKGRDAIFGCTVYDNDFNIVDTDCLSYTAFLEPGESVYAKIWSNQSRPIYTQMVIECFSDSWEPESSLDFQTVVSAGSNFTLSVIEDSDYVSYQWYRIDGVYLDSGDKSTVLLEGATSSTYTISSILESKYYYCLVRKGNGSAGACMFSVLIDNGLSASAYNDSYNISVVKNEPFELRVEATSNDNEVYYQWFEDIYTPTDSYSDPITTGGNSSVLNVEGVDSDTYYYCLVTDKYQNYQVVYFAITATDPVVGPVASGTCGAQGDNLAWTLDVNGVLTISGIGEMADYLLSSIPWLDHRSEIVSIVIDEGVTSIGNYAFARCSNAETVSFPKSLSTIKEYAFYGCNSLSEVDYYGSELMAEDIAIDSTNSIINSIEWNVLGMADVLASGSCGKNANWTMYADGLLVISGSGSMTSSPWRTEYKESIRKVTIESGLSSILGSSFYQCNNLFDVSIPNTVTSIGQMAFCQCEQIKEITIPNSVTTIGIYAFAYCNNLSSVLLPEGLRIIDNYSFYKCNMLDTIIIPNSVESLGNDAFYDCTRLRSIVLSQNLSSIGNRSFYECESLEYIFIPESVTSIGEYAFAYCKSLKYVDIHNEVFSIGRSAFSFCESLEYFSIPQNVTRIEDSTFYYCRQLKNVSLPDGIQYIGSQAFYHCDILSDIVIPEDTSFIGDYAFYFCDGLTSLVIPEGITSIGERTFFECSYLTSLTLPKSLQSIGEYAIYWCDRLKDVYFTGTQNDWDNVVIANSSTYELNRATLHCSWVYAVKEGSIRDDLFWTRYSDGSLVISGSGGIPDYTGSDKAPWADKSSKITSITIEKGVTGIGDYAFTNCENLKTVVIEEGVRDIGEGAFFGCISLESVSIPFSVVNIEVYAFGACDAISNVVYLGPESEWANVTMAEGNEFLQNVYTQFVYKSATYIGANLALKGNLSMNFFVSAPEDGWTAEMTYKKDGSVRTVTMDSSIYNNTAGGYKIMFTDLAAKEMTEVVELAVKDKNNQNVLLYNPKTNKYQYSIPYSVTTYAALALSESTDPNEIALVHALLNYGETAQYFFKHNLNDLANPEGFCRKKMDRDVSQFINTEYNAEIPSNAYSELGFLGGSLVLKGDTAVRLYFRDPITATLNGQVVTVNHNSAGYYIERPNIASKDLDTKFEFIVNVTGTNYTFKYCALSWCNNTMSNASYQSEWDVCKALYLYNEAANEFFK